MKAQIDIVQGKGKGKGKNVAASKKAKAMRDAVKGTDTTADLWATILVPAKNQAEMKKEQGMVARTVAVGVNFSADLALLLNLGTDADASAAKLVGMVQAQLPQLVQAAGAMGMSKAAKSLTVTSDGPAVKMGLTLTEPELMKMVDTVKQFSGMAGGNP
jgi:hypothetical protein